MRTAATKSRPVLSRCSSSRSRVVARDVAVLAADHPERRVDELAGDAGRLVGQREPQRLGEQRVAGEQRDPLAERDVRARAPAPLVVVVHRRQVVVDEREGVDELERRRRGERVVDRASVRLGDGEAEHGPHALASGLERVAQRLLEPAELGSERERAQIRLDGVAELVSRPHRPGLRARVSSASIWRASSASSEMRSTAASPSTSSAAARRSSSSRAR